MLFTHKVGVFYIDHCKVVANDERLSFIRAENSTEKYFSIPHANVCVLLLGPGTSVTHRAAFKMAEEGVIYGYVGGGGTPLFHASQSEYRPTEYCQAWVSRWENEYWRLEAAKLFARMRVERVNLSYPKLFNNTEELKNAGNVFNHALDSVDSIPQLMGHEANYAKSVYAFNRIHFGQVNFKRTPQGLDPTNKFIDNGNYLAYGLAASVLWILGIPHAFPVTHGMTRRGALVFDLADTIKDAALLPLAFQSFKENEKAPAHRKRCTDSLEKTNSMVFMFDAVKRVLEMK